MEDIHLDESDIAERYVTGRLSAEERAGFEAHFVDCAQCLDRIEAAVGLRDGLARSTPRERALRSRIPRRSRPPAFAMAFAASIVLLLAFPVGLSLRAASRAEKALEADR